MTDQDYYWAPQWQSDEQVVRYELERREFTEFDNADDAVAWLMGDSERS